MEDKNLSTKLQELAKGKNRPATARIRERFEEIELTLKAGVSRRDVYKALVEDGIEITFESFELTIYRLRQEKTGNKQRSGKTLSNPATPSTQSVAPATQAVSASNPCHALSSGTGVGIPEVKFEAAKKERN
jgi:hypothetical protein